MLLRESGGASNVITSKFHIQGSVLRVLRMCPRMPPKDAFGKRLGLADLRKEAQAMTKSSMCAPSRIR